MSKQVIEQVIYTLFSRFWNQVWNRRDFIDPTTGKVVHICIYVRTDTPCTLWETWQSGVCFCRLLFAFWSRQLLEANSMKGAVEVLDVRPEQLTRTDLGEQQVGGQWEWEWGGVRMLS